MDIEIAKKLARLSYIVYEKPDLIKKLIEQTGTFTYLDRHNIEAFILENDDNITIVCRGTETSSLQDIINNFNISKIYIENVGYVHKGYYDYAHELYTNIKLSDKPLYITGHSQGGAIASILRILFNKGECYTFGSPRLIYKNIEIENIYAFDCYSDILSQFPWFPIYENIGELYFITKNLTITNKRNSLLNKLLNSKKIYKGHVIDTYVEYLKNLKIV